MPTSPRRRRRRFWAGYPYYDLYETADGRYLAIAALEKRFWERLCATTDNEELLEAHRADSERRRERVRETLAETFAGAPVETWERRLERADMPAAAVRSVAAALEDPSIRDRLVHERAAGERVSGLFGSGDGQGVDPPALGEHTGAVLEAAGVDPATVDRLADPDPPER